MTVLVISYVDQSGSMATDRANSARVFSGWSPIADSLIFDYHDKEITVWPPFREATRALR